MCWPRTNEWLKMQTLELHGKESGQIWHRKIASKHGLLVSIIHSVFNVVDLPLKTVHFLQATFDRNGNRLLAVDQRGNVYTFDLIRNKYELVHRTGTSCTALAFNLRNEAEFLIAMPDFTVKCFDASKKEFVAWMKGHSSPVKEISVDMNGDYCITTSAEIAFLWELKTFERKRKLTITNKADVCLFRAFFCPVTNYILTCFRDDSILVWEAKNLEFKYQLLVPDKTPPYYRCFAVTNDGRTLVAGGKSSYLQIWNLETHKLIKIIELPKTTKEIKEMEFICENFDSGSHKIIAMLCQDGILRFADIETCCDLFQLGNENETISHFRIGSNGKFCTCIMVSGQLNIYDLPSTWKELNKVSIELKMTRLQMFPPSPMVSVLRSKENYETNNDNSQMTCSKASSTICSRNTRSSQKTVSTNKKVSNRRRSHSASTRDHRSTRLSDKTSLSSYSLDNSAFRELPEGLNFKKLYQILRYYGEYPSKYRAFIWRCLMRLPENHGAFAALVDKGGHLVFAKLQEQYPLKSRKLLRIMQRVLSALAHWSSIFGETDYLPLLAFPFVKLFENNQLICFEVIATVLFNWCQQWFMYFPNPPVNILGIIENLLTNHDHALLAHFTRHKVTSEVYAWPLLETLFSEVFTRDEWLCLFDHIFTLLRVIDLDDFKYFFHHRNPISLQSILTESYRLSEITPIDLDPKRMIESFQPLTKGQYPVFNKYPKFIVDYQIQEKEKLRQEEMGYIRQRELNVELYREREQRRNEEEAWLRQQQLLIEAEEKRRKLLLEEDMRVKEQKTKLQTLNQEIKVRELQLLDVARRKMLHQQHLMKEAELRRLDDEIRKKQMLRLKSDNTYKTSKPSFDENILNLDDLLDEQSLRGTKRLIADARNTHHFPNEISMDNENVALRYEMCVNGEECKDNMTEVWKELREAKAKELEVKKHLNDMYKQKNELNTTDTNKLVEIMTTMNVQREKTEVLDRPNDTTTNAIRSPVKKKNDHIEKHVDDLTTESYHTSEVIRSMNKPTNVRCINTPNVSVADTSISSGLNLDRGRHELENDIRKLLTDIRDRRTRLVHENSQPSMFHNSSTNGISPIQT
ncbi:unnamed protein product [Didymodactylos carnosus]|uniref:TBC1 domain family member 31 n=1 Tax=Didymodactylos carnosus TaxID=1234261 RepID=A0A813UP23_9BILA|nr:unnamed protein product [Didymodactylos carnosus]CAF0830136.1 unnamed protein product [Didymodactylos carnosus]CAF3593578.1 unnamed protein product [Didymodactylos carnosus]CAF3617329.1 unnamed protein product [Didymodactylos carnosus]